MSSCPIGQAHATPFQIMPFEQVCVGVVQMPLTNVSPEGHTQAAPFQYEPPEQVCTGVVQIPFTNSCPDGQTHADPFSGSRRCMSVAVAALCRTTNKDMKG